MNNINRPIYLAGPVDYTDDPTSWRDELKAEYPDIDFIDPVEKFPNYPDDPGVVVDWCLEQAEHCDLLVGRLTTAKTVGTHHEISRALAAGRNVVIEGDDVTELSNFLTYRHSVDEPGTVYYERSLDDCLHRLAKLEMTPDSSENKRGKYRFPELSGLDIFDLRQVYRYGGEKRGLDWLRSTIHYPLKYEDRDGYSEDEFYRFALDHYLDRTEEGAQQNNPPENPSSQPSGES